MAIALRAVVEITTALSYDRITRNVTPLRTLQIAQFLSAAVLVSSAFALGQAWGAYAVFVAVSSLARLRVIHFGVLALAQLGSAAPRALPVVYACGRGGANPGGPAAGGIRRHWFGSADGRRRPEPIRRFVLAAARRHPGGSPKYLSSSAAR